MPQEHCVIIGNGPAGNEAAVALRDRDSGLRITLIGRERARYYRPHQLPDYVAGKLTEEDLFVNPPDFYRERDIKLRLAQTVVGVDFGTRNLFLDHKEKIAFDGLIIATGGTPRIPEPIQVFERLMMKLKTLADAAAWKEKLGHVQSVLLIGGDLTSFVFAGALLHLGKKVSFILNEDSFWPVKCTPEVFSAARGSLAARGVHVIECERLEDLRPLGEHSLEARVDGCSVEVGAVGAFFGLVPDVRFLCGSGLHIDRGVIVDEFLRTNFDGAYAAGDCAQVYHPELRDYWVSIGYRNARNLGKIAAGNLLGDSRKAAAAAEGIFRIEGISVRSSWWTEF